MHEEYIDPSLIADLSVAGISARHFDQSFNRSGLHLSVSQIEPAFKEH